jgi:hypothetical protein
MRVRFTLCRRQVAFFLVLLLFTACIRNEEEIIVVPPLTNPLDRNFIGYGVINDSFVRLTDEPRRDGVSLGYIRRGALIKIIERRLITNRGYSEIWIRAEAEYSGGVGGKVEGWLPEDSAEIYDNESRAFTASRTMTK